MITNFIRLAQPFAVLIPALFFLLLCLYGWWKDRPARRAMKEWHDYEKSINWIRSGNSTYGKLARRDPYPFHRPNWRGHGQGHRPAPIKHRPSFWSVMIWLVLGLAAIAGFVLFGLACGAAALHFVWR